MAAFVAVIYLVSVALCIVVAVAIISNKKMRKLGILFFVCSMIPILNTIVAVCGIICFDIEDLVP